MVTKQTQKRIMSYLNQCNLATSKFRDRTIIRKLMLTQLQNFSELEQLQNEKRKALLEHETAKLRECDEALQRELRDWKSQLHPRKQVCTIAILRFIRFIFVYKKIN